MKKVIALSLLSFQLLDLRAQDIADSFVQVQIPIYHDWLRHCQLDRFISVDTIQTEGGSAILFLKTKDVNNWLRLSHYLDSAFHADLPRLLFDRFVFQLDINRDSAQVNVAGIDQAFIITSHAGKMDIRAIITQGEPSDGIALPLSGILDPENRRTIPFTKTIEEIHPRLLSGLKNYFSKFSTTAPYKFDDLSDNDSAQLYEVSNITKVVLEDSYFEKLTLTFDLATIGKKTNLSYKVQGKYAGGLLWAPHDSRYQPMTPEFQEQLDKFIRSFGNQIKTILQ